MREPEIKPEKIRHAARAEERAIREPGLVQVLGRAVLVGMEEIAFGEQLIGTAVSISYSTHFSMPDGQEWCLQVARREDQADAR